MQKVQLIVNPISGRGRGVSVVPRIEACLRGLGYNPSTFVTQSRGDARDCAASLDRRTSLILVVGGDGTLNEVINGQHEIPLALFPVGTGNAFAKDQGIQGRMDFLEALLREGVVECFDVGQAGGKKFLNMAASGILGEIHRSFWEHRNGPESLARCLVKTLKVLWRKPFPRLAVWCDGTLVTRTASIAVISNIRTYAPRISFTPLASPFDGFFDVCIFPEPSRLDLVRWFIGMLRGLHLQDDGIRHLRGRTMCLEGERVACHVDGEYTGQTPLRVSMLPRCVPILLPPTVGGNACVPPPVRGLTRAAFC
jgi:diacylglycerol kinase (ATP)